MIFIWFLITVGNCELKTMLQPFSSLYFVIPEVNPGHACKELFTFGGLPCGRPYLNSSLQACPGFTSGMTK